MQIQPASRGAHSAMIVYLPIPRRFLQLYRACIQNKEMQEKSDSMSQHIF